MILLVQFVIKLHSPYELMQFCYSLKKFTRAHLFQSALKIL